MSKIARVSLEQRAVAFYHHMAETYHDDNNWLKGYSILDIAKKQGISKPMARRVWQQLRTMQLIVTKSQFYRTNTSKTLFNPVRMNADIPMWYRLQCDAMVKQSYVNRSIAKIMGE